MTDSELEQIAVNVIIEYKNKNLAPDEVKTLYPLAIPLIVANIKQSLTIDKNIASMTQGSRSVSYKEKYEIIDDVIKSILGKPYLRLF